MRKGRRTRRARRVLCLAALLLAWAGAGCAGHNHEGDPLVGDFGNKRADVRTPDPPPPTRTKSPVPPVPEATAATSNAAMAVGQPLVGGRPLAIDDRPPENRSGWQGPGWKGPSQVPGTPTGTGPTLGQPQPIIEAVPQIQAPQPVPVVPTPFSEAGGGPRPQQWMTPSYEQLQAQLRARGVLTQKLNVLPDGRVQLMCTLPDRANPNTPIVVEGYGTDPPSAIQDALNRIDRR